ncbi:Cytochrome c-type biogenesis protein DsbD,protein-disulfide reductase [Klebsiella pneumoniae subsp. pneumoniae ST512-K30BO]|nr:Cytochrome c-type biogenesis protein DsbD,protein-disulfide reductase [Klebsiella pneumoniae subsp. pneumoniae ST512-K30BO]
MVLHSDPRWLPERQRAWASWNYRLSDGDLARACVTYNMNILQGLPAGAPLFCVTLNPDAPVDDRYVWQRFVYEHPLFNPQSWSAQLRREEINGQQRSWYCGAYWYNGFHEAQAPAMAPPADVPARLPFTALWALLIGIGIAFTPCVLPMYPLISGIVLGGKQRLSTARALLLAFIYVQGMALTYTALGLVVAAAGLQFQAALQHPYVLVGLSAVFILLALSMFGLFTLQLPSSLQTRLTLLSNKRQGGSPGGVFAMGAIAGLICSPCTTAPLSAILLYIAQSGNLWLGGGTLYLYALGMGLPLILVTVFGNRLLPKSGPWMSHVKTAFGFVILALPVFLLERIFGDQWGLRLWSMLGVAFFSWAFITSLGATRPWMRLVQIILLAAALVSARPLQDWAFGAPAVEQQAHLAFTRVSSVAELDQALAQAKGQPVMLDLYADWCVACKEFEKYTFSSPDVQQALKGTVLLQVDVTKNSPQDVALLRHLQVLGLPTILFFNAEGQEQPERRVTGFMDAAAFSAHLRDWQA